MWNKIFFIIHSNLLTERVKVLNVKIIISDLLLGFDDDTVSFLASLDLSLDSTVLAFMMLLSPSFALWS